MHQTEVTRIREGARSPMRSAFDMRPNVRERGEVTAWDWIVIQNREGHDSSRADAGREEPAFSR